MSNLSTFCAITMLHNFKPIQTGKGGGGGGRGGGGGGRGALEPAPTLKIRNFQTVKAMTTKFGDFS